MPLLQHLPASAHLACVSLALLAARKNGSLKDFKNVVLALAAKEYEPLDLPSVPLFILLQPDLTTGEVRETQDASLMSEVVHIFLDSAWLSEDEKAKLETLAQRYRQRASVFAAHDLTASRGTSSTRPWWKLW